MEILAPVAAVLGIFAPATTILTRRKSRKPRSGGTQAHIAGDIDVSGDGNQIVQVAGNATFRVAQSPSDNDSPTPLPKGAACPHLKPEFVDNGRYKAVPNWKSLGGYTSVDGDVHSFKCLFDCGQTFGGIKSYLDKRQDEAINAYCVDGDPSQPSDLLMKFWQERGLLH